MINGSKMMGLMCSVMYVLPINPLASVAWNETITSDISPDLFVLPTDLVRFNVFPNWN
jgi:hypothetical protein